MLYQQGDVLIETSRVPENAKNQTVGFLKEKGLILAEGELTGHAHVILNPEKSSIFVDEDGRMYLKTECSKTITHEEHEPVILPEGEYIIRYVREYDHFAEEAKQIED